MRNVLAPAKVNLFLHVGDRRADGFHDLQSLVVFAEVGDALSFAPDSGLSLSIDGRFARGLETDDGNLILRAARALQKHAHTKKGARISLTKNLPVASGIGGGSADAAAALRGLASLWDLDVPHEAMRELGALIGSDVPVCVDSKPAWMEGRGEHVRPAGYVTQAPMVLVNPGVAVPTGPVFQALTTRSGTGRPMPDLPDDGVEGLAPYAARFANDLEAPAIAIAPVIGDVLKALKGQGAMLARMSGSGATCFGLFADDGAADEAAKHISTNHPEWWVVATRIAAPEIGSVHGGQA